MLPYKHAKESDGMTIPAKNVSYVRSSGNAERDQFFINHEFDEIMQKNSDHEIDGVRYGFWSFVKNLFKAVLPKILFGIAEPAASYGISKLIGGVEQPQQQQQTPKLPAFSPSPTTSAFAPQTQKPLGQEQFNTSVANLDKNAQLQEKSIFDKFRGLGTTTQNTAFNKTLSNTRTSSQLAKDQFLQDQKKLGSTFA